MRETILTVKPIELIEDFSLYPRTMVDEHHIQQMRYAFRAGTQFPMIVIDRKSKRIADGWHRKRMYQSELESGSEIEVIAKDYPDDAAMFLDAVRLNSHHGRMLSPFERIRIKLRADELKIEASRTAAALNITTEALERLVGSKTAKVRLVKKTRRGGFETVVIKRTIANIARGTVLTKQQAAVNEKLSGQSAIRQVRELIALLENDLMDLGDFTLVEALHCLASLINRVPKSRAATDNWAKARRQRAAI